MKIRHLTILLIVLTGLWSCGKNTALQPDDTDPTDISFGTAATLDIVTWNLEVFPENTDLDALKQMLRALNADVIALQEIMDASALVNLVNTMPEYDYYIYDDTSEYRLAYLVDNRSVVVNDAYTIYNGEGNPFPRAPFVLDISWQNKDFFVINNHFKAFGDNYIDPNDDWDDERRRQLACQMLDEYISTSLPEERVVVLGDLNDQINEPIEYNVFQVFLDKPQEYKFADMAIATNPNNSNVSYPSSNSHIDHILISNELFGDFAASGNYCRSIRAENWVGSWSMYAETISDHRPVGIRLGN